MLKGIQGAHIPCWSDNHGSLYTRCINHTDIMYHYFMMTFPVCLYVQCKPSEERISIVDPFFLSFCRSTLICSTSLWTLMSVCWLVSRAGIISWNSRILAHAPIGSIFLTQFQLTACVCNIFCFNWMAWPHNRNFQYWIKVYYMHAPSRIDTQHDETGCIEYPPFKTCFRCHRLFSPLLSIK